VSLFTNVLIDHAMKYIKDHWRFISRDCYLLEEEFIKEVKFVLDSIFFVFDNVTIYISRITIMSSPLSPIITDLVLRKEIKTLFLIRFPLPFYYSFVDDILLAAYYLRFQLVPFLIFLILSILGFSSLWIICVSLSKY